MNTYFLDKRLRFRIFRLFVITAAVLWFFHPGNHIAQAQESQGLDLSLSRDFGFSSGTGKIQGTFSMKVSSSIALQKVVFYIDDTAIGEDKQAPFQFQFTTSNYSLGEHTIHARGYSAQGQEFSSNEIRVQFVSADEGWQTALKIAIPILALTLGAMILSFAIPFMIRRGKTNQVTLPERYGIFGGAICPKCHLPFNIPVIKINLMMGSLAPCPHCGKWSIVQRVSPTEFKTALEAAKAEQNLEVTSNHSEEASREEIEDSRYMDL
jgi:hypothetical protein